MTATTVAQGFLGNLTTDQESRLRQLWSIVLKLHDAGAQGSHDAPGATNGDRRASLSRTETAASANPNSAYTNEFAQTLQDVGIQGAELKSVRDALANTSIDDLRQSLLSTAKHDHPDALMLRFLRARKWDVNKAFVMMLHALVWRVKEQHVDDQVIARSELEALKDSQNKSDPQAAKAGSQFLAQMRCGKAYFHGVDRVGRPIGVVKARLHKPAEQSEEVINRYILHVIETARLLLVPPMENVTIVFDLTGFSLSNMEYAPVKFLIDCFQQNYPESLGTMLIHNAPWVFSGIWRIIKAWMDPVIVSKIHFTNSVADLEKFIAPDQIVKELKGKEDWEYEYIEPVEGENAKMADITTRDELTAERQRIGDDLLRVTGEWIEAAKANNKQQVDEVKARRADVAEDLRLNYWKLDPYVRGRNCLDRTGVIRQGGKIDFYPSADSLSDAELAKALEVEHVERTQVKVVNV
ncbi:CRAL-TRIO domain-containing protein [Aspergillus melleus]|uniref:CRAL-TRIO domain-containing protein n=1 Tax=Aspergillus melleus TaxID=138277 RepID=UPI001E8DFE6F|nr:phosphatidylinositol transfer protein csr1 [Aspergillus melleus]KAH8422286.1 phosphatidylinositol transfer protein csr1 [Aspergillus melleus]